jgi:hypothetical protein
MNTRARNSASRRKIVASSRCQLNRFLSMANETRSIRRMGRQYFVTACPEIVSTKYCCRLKNAQHYWFVTIGHEDRAQSERLSLRMMRGRQRLSSSLPSNYIASASELRIGHTTRLLSLYSPAFRWQNVDCLYQVNLSSCLVVA